MGHLGPDKEYQLTKKKVFSPRMEEDIAHFVTRICSCVKKKLPHVKPVAPFGTITITQTMEIVSIDFLHLDHLSGNYEYLLCVFTDHFTRCTLAYLTRNKSSCSTAERIFSDLILRFGMPKHILYDQAKELDNKLFHQLTKMCGVKQLRTTLYLPQTDRTVERMNSTICSMLKTLTDKEKTT